MLTGYDAFIPHFKPDVFVLKYLGSFLFVGNIIWWKIYKGTAKIAPEAVDLVSGRREFEESESTQDSRWNGSFWKDTISKLRR